MSDDFDPPALARLPKLDVPQALSLSLRLIEAAPQSPPATVRSGLEALREARADLAGRALGVDQAQRSAPLRWPDGDVVLAWRALHNRLEGYTMLPPDRYPLATRAAALLGALFPTGIDFVKAAGEGRPGELRRRHQRLRDEAMRAELVAVAGGDFVDELDRVMSIDRGRPSLSLSRPEAPLPAPLSGSLASLQRTLAAYLLQLVAMHDEGNAQARMAVRVAFGPVTQMGVSLAGAAERTPRRAMLASVAAPGN